LGHPRYHNFPVRLERESKRAEPKGCPVLIVPSTPNVRSNDPSLQVADDDEIFSCGAGRNVAGDNDLSIRLDDDGLRRTVGARNIGDSFPAVAERGIKGSIAV
jgi:hypothetical protein